MILRSFIFLTAFIRYGLPASTQIQGRREMSLSECAAKGGECDETRGRPVCGTDDQTYPTRCHLLRVQCIGHQVSLKYRGPCRACKEAREYALKHKSKRPTNFVPHCKADGTYAAVQCLADTGCWCSDVTGKPIDNTTVRAGKPNCRQFKANKRRSPARGPGRKRACNQVDRAAFNDNLINVFQSEYMRSAQVQQQQTQSKNGNPTKPSDDLVLNWKFAQMDINNNQILDKIEFRELKKLVKRAIKPKRCGRTLGKFCDIDDDDRLTPTEWFGCMTKDGINHLIASGSASSGQQHHTNNNNHQQTIQQTHNRPSLFPNQPNPIHLHNIIHTDSNGNNINHQNKFIHHSLDDLENESTAHDDDESSQNLNLDYEEYEEGDDDEGISNLNLKHETNIPYLLRPKPESPLKESESESDCLTDQANALEEQRQGGTIYYVPECTPDGRYQRVQCYRSTPYCWCVNEDTGKNIDGTSVKDKRPQCDAVFPMKGCPEPRKTIFLKDLKEFLKNQLLSNANIGANATKWISEDERIATMSFVILDKNKNKALERKEWKTFRELMTNTKNLRKCGKKMPRYCDVNSDKKITLSEWLNCLQTQRNEPETTQPTMLTNNETATNKTSRLMGSNPLEIYLQDE